MTGHNLIWVQYFFHIRIFRSILKIDIFIFCVFVRFYAYVLVRVRFSLCTFERYVFEYTSLEKFPDSSNLVKSLKPTQTHSHSGYIYNGKKRENGFERWENNLKCSSNRNHKNDQKSNRGQKWERSNHGRGQWSLPSFMTWTIWNHNFSTWVRLNSTINRTVPLSYRRFPDHLITAS